MGAVARADTHAPVHSFPGAYSSTIGRPLLAVLSDAAYPRPMRAGDFDT